MSLRYICGYTDYEIIKTSNIYLLIRDMWCCEISWVSRPKNRRQKDEVKKSPHAHTFRASMTTFDLVNVFVIELSCWIYDQSMKQPIFSYIWLTKDGSCQIKLTTRLVEIHGYITPNSVSFLSKRNIYGVCQFYILK